jgi:hypothetical protein
MECCAVAGSAKYLAIHRLRHRWLYVSYDRNKETAQPLDGRIRARFALGREGPPRSIERYPYDHTCLFIIASSLKFSFRSWIWSGVVELSKPSSTTLVHFVRELHPAPLPFFVELKLFGWAPAPGGVELELELELCQTGPYGRCLPAPRACSDQCSRIRGTILAFPCFFPLSKVHGRSLNLYGYVI